MPLLPVLFQHQKSLQVTYFNIYMHAILTNGKNVSADILYSLVVANDSLKLATCIAAQRNSGLTEKKDFSFPLLHVSKGYKVKTARDPYKSMQQPPSLAAKGYLNCILLNNFLKAFQISKHKHYGQM